MCGSLWIRWADLSHTNPWPGTPSHPVPLPGQHLDVRLMYSLGSKNLYLSGYELLNIGCPFSNGLKRSYTIHAERSIAKPTLPDGGGVLRKHQSSGHPDEPCYAGMWTLSLRMSSINSILKAWFPIVALCCVCWEIGEEYVMWSYTITDGSNVWFLKDFV